MEIKNMQQKLVDAVKVFLPRDNAYVMAIYKENRPMWTRTQAWVDDLFAVKRFIDNSVLDCVDIGDVLKHKG